MTKKNSKLSILIATGTAWFAQAVYAISPIDLIPDLIPVLGWADDFLGFVLVLAISAYAIYRIREKTPATAHEPILDPNLILPMGSNRGSESESAQNYAPMTPEQIRAL